MRDELSDIYRARFGERSAERTVLWQTLTESYFQRFVGPDDTVLDLAAGYCEFINAIRVRHARSPSTSTPRWRRWRRPTWWCTTDAATTCRPSSRARSMSCG